MTKKRLISTTSPDLIIEVDSEVPGKTMITIGSDIENEVQIPDDQISGKHAILEARDDGVYLTNLSNVNPIHINNFVMTVDEPQLINDDDVLKIGEQFFEVAPSLESEQTTQPPQSQTLRESASHSLFPFPENRFYLKVMSGPQAGAEIDLDLDTPHVIGSNYDTSDIVFYSDSATSDRHLTIQVSENEVSIQDLGSTNGTYVNGERIEAEGNKDITPLTSEVLVGSTTFIVVDRHAGQKTIAIPPPKAPEPEPTETAAKEEEEDWKEMKIPHRHLTIAGGFVAVFIVFLMSYLTIFSSKEVVKPIRHAESKLEDVLKPYPEIVTSYNPTSGSLFITGHVQTEVDHKEMTYLIHGLPFVTSLEDFSVIDELVWKSMNSLLSTYSQWQGVTIHSPKAGEFMMRGYLQTLEEKERLTEYMNLNFPYLDRLNNQVVVESNLQLQINTLLMKGGFNNIRYDLSDGVIVLSGVVSNNQREHLSKTVDELKALTGVREVNNFIAFVKANTTIADLSVRYPVSGYSSKGGKVNGVQISGKIFTVGDLVDGMKITKITNKEVFLEKGGLKFKITYNQQ